MSVLSQLLEHKMVAIIRGAKTSAVMEIAGALYAGGIRALEITFNSPDALKTVEELSAKMGGKLLLGMGTVLSAKAAKDAVSAGAKFIISPTVDKATIRATRRLGAVSIPGAFTATEILYAHNNGGEIIKVFPASVGAGYIKDILGPLPHISLMPTGGITLENAREYFKAGAVAVGVGSSLVNTKQEITGEYLKQLSAKAREFVRIVN